MAVANIYVLLFFFAVGFGQQKQQQNIVIDHIVLFLNISIGPEFHNDDTATVNQFSIIYFKSIILTEINPNVVTKRGSLMSSVLPQTLKGLKLEIFARRKSLTNT